MQTPYIQEPSRGITGGRTAGFGTIPFARKLAEANRDILAVLVIEDAEGSRNCGGGANVSGADRLLEGAIDLSQCAARLPV